MYFSKLKRVGITLKLIFGGSNKEGLDLISLDHIDSQLKKWISDFKHFMFEILQI